MIKVNDIDYSTEMYNGILFGSTKFDNDWGATVRANPEWGWVVDAHGNVLDGAKRVSYPFLLTREDILKFSTMTATELAKEFFDVKACPHKYGFDIAKIAVPINSVVAWEDDLDADAANEYLVSIADSPKCEL